MMYNAMYMYDVLIINVVAAVATCLISTLAQ